VTGPLRFLADESCDFVVVRALRVAGYDVLAIAEQASGTSDRDVIQLALDDGRVLLTEDKDFGQLVFAAFAGSRGVILIRFPSDARAVLASVVVRVVDVYATRLSSAFVTLSPGRVRISGLPSE
jgi:predicted nuclease of predicted toxin-antitoxin system